MQSRRYLAMIPLIVMFLSSSCTSTAPIRIDGSTPASFQASWVRLHRSLSASDQVRLDLAVLPIAFAQYGGIKDVPPGLMAGVGPESIREQINGLTFREIIILAKASPVKVDVGFVR